MSTKADMRARIADDIDRDDLNSDIDKAISRAIRFYEKELFYFQETSTAFVTLPGQQTYSAGSVPSDLKEILSLKLNRTSTAKDLLNRRSFQWLEQYDTASHSGPPTDYAEWAGNIVFYPTPNETYTATVCYRKKYDELATDGASNDWTTEAEDLIEARATWWICSRKLKDFEGAQAAKAEEAESLIALRSKTENKVMLKGGGIKPTEF